MQDAPWHQLVKRRLVLKGSVNLPRVRSVDPLRLTSGKPHPVPYDDTPWQACCVTRTAAADQRTSEVQTGLERRRTLCWASSPPLIHSTPAPVIHWMMSRSWSSPPQACSCLPEGRLGANRLLTKCTPCWTCWSPWIRFGLDPTGSDWIHGVCCPSTPSEHNVWQQPRTHQAYFSR